MHKGESVVLYNWTRPRWQHASPCCCSPRIIHCTIAPPSCTSLYTHCSCICAPTPPSCCIFSRKFHVPRSSEQLTRKIWLRTLSTSSSPLHFCFFSSQHPLPKKTGLLQRRLLTFNAIYEKHSRFTRSTLLQPCALLFTSTSRSQATSSTSPTRSRCSSRAASRHVPPAYSISTPRASSVSVFRTRHSGTWTSSSGRWSTRSTCEPPRWLCSAARDCVVAGGASGSVFSTKK